MDTPQQRAEPNKPEAEAVMMTVVDVQSEPPMGRSSGASSCRTLLRENLVLLLTLVGVLLGFAIGFGVRELNPSEDTLMWIGMPGELFLRMLNLMIVPLIVGSVISGTSTVDPRSNGKISMVALAWIITTNVLGCLMGVLLSVTIRPGEGSSVTDESEVTSPFETQDIFADLLRNLIPSNIVELGFRKAVTTYSSESSEVTRNLTNGTTFTETITSQTKAKGKADSVNVLGLIFVCLIFGIAANRLGERADIFVRFFSVLTDIVLTVLRWFFWTSPVGVTSLIAQAIAGIEDLQDSFSKLGLFVMVVVVGVLVLQLGVLSLLLLLLTRRNPLLFHGSILRPYFLSFAATSTAVAIPEMIYCCEVKNKIDKRVTRFVVPFSVTLSANGSAVFIVSSAIFISQYIGRDLSASDIIIVAFLTAVSAMALPSVPSSSLVTLVIILASLNIPSSTIALLFAVEWLLDRVRTGCSVVSHCYCAAVAHHFCIADLVRRDREEASGEEAPLKHDENNAHGDLTLNTKF
ncbi:excitatory amino acid transporter-like [Babylonia areolata]|uniref:excitatory amino acid transporter-like n=1 Tax=Babylonia areolata TaxID=304850 RepID=UPI003FD32324